jgi:ribosomal-protein-alanine N-acetyltransferase
MDNNTKAIQTDRLILRKFNMEDANDMYNNWGSDPECCKYLAWNVHKNVEETKAILKSWIEGYNNGSYNWVVEIKNTHEIIGSICVITALEKHSTCELAYCYGSKYWGNGYATEALRTVIEYLLKECNFYLVEARHISGNPASGRVMEKAGMHKDAVLRNRRVNKHTGERNDTIVYSITKEEL